jgi:hypothetical protein
MYIALHRRIVYVIIKTTINKSLDEFLRKNNEGLQKIHPNQLLFLKKESLNNGRKISHYSKNHPKVLVNLLQKDDDRKKKRIYNLTSKATCPACIFLYGINYSDM